MSSLYKRGRHFWWSTKYKGRRIQKSTGQSRRDFARKVVNDWDLKMALGDTGFLNLNNQSPIDVQSYFKDYLIFVEKRKSDKTYEVTKGVLKKFEIFLKKKKIERIDEITVKLLDDYIEWLDNAPKTKKNYLNIISIMLKHALIYELIPTNPAEKVSKPRVPKNAGNIRHRLLEPTDLEIILSSAGNWYMYFMFLYHTGLRAGDVALLKYGNINKNKKAIVSLIRKSRRIHEFPIAEQLINLLLDNQDKDTPLFPMLYKENEKQLNWKLSMPRKHMQTMLRLNGRPKATLHSFRHTFNHELAKLGLQIGDRQILLAHSSSETTKVYTHPNFELAQRFVNRIPIYGKQCSKKCSN
ncbi:tyrosine-type recombinase/integrase [Candidatus Neomarinimicrobiota bacterium]